MDCSKRLQAQTIRKIIILRSARQVKESGSLIAFFVLVMNIKRWDMVVA